LIDPICGTAGHRYIPKHLPPDPRSGRRLGCNGAATAELHDTVDSFDGRLALAAAKAREGLKKA
jgi:hypothetical protein